MVRISDILRKAKEPARKEEKTALNAPSLSSKDGVSTSSFVEPNAPSGEQLISAPDAQNKTIKGGFPASNLNLNPQANNAALDEKTAGLYEGIFLLAKEIFKENADYSGLDIKRVTGEIEKIVAELAAGDEKLLFLVSVKNAAASSSRLSHPINVCMYSIQAGLGLGYPKPVLLELAVLAFLHDTGIAKYLFSLCQQEKTDAKECAGLNKYSVISSQLMAYIDSLGSPEDNSRPGNNLIEDLNYIKVSKGKFLEQCSKIIDIADIYDEMTHYKAHSSLEAIQEILNNKDKFGQEIIKSFIDRVGIFRVGVLVRLNTKELARVIKSNCGRPLRPVIKVIVNAEGQWLKEDKILDLSERPTVYIKGEER